MKKRNKLIIFASTIFLVGGSYVVYNKFNTPEAPNQSMTTKQQKSLIQAELTATENNAKPKDVIGAFKAQGRYDKLNTDNKKAADAIMYNSVQNASLYYNNLNTILAGEIEYSGGTKGNPLDGTKENKILYGFSEEVKDQYLQIKPISASSYLVLPDWKKLSDISDNKDNNESSYVIEAGKDADKLKVFEGNRINVYNAAKAYDRVDKKLDELKDNHPNSEYIQDLNSLLRIYNDITFGYVETNNISRTDKDGVVKIDNQTMSELKKLANSGLGLSSEAESYLKEVKENKIKSTVLQKGAEESTQKYGTSRFWQGQTDISSLMKAQGQNVTSEDNKGDENGKNK